VDDCSNYDATMLGRLSTPLLLAVLGAALFAGCGKSSTSATSVTTNPGVATSGTGQTPTANQEVALCQRSIERLKTLPASSKARLKASCEKAGTSEAGKRQVVHEVCVEMALQLPSPAARARAQKICRAP
jgi:hypothetical protein